MFGRVLRTGLSWLRHQAASRVDPSGFNPSRFARRHPGLLFAVIGSGLGMFFDRVMGLHALGMVVVIVTALNIGDAWDEETIA